MSWRRVLFAVFGMVVFGVPLALATWLALTMTFLVVKDEYGCYHTSCTGPFGLLMISAPLSAIAAVGLGFYRWVARIEEAEQPDR
jgi:hypothetical protein